MDKKIRCAGADVAYGLCNTKDNGFAMVGSTTSFGAGGTDIYFVKTDANGIAGCNESADTLQAGIYSYQETIPPIPLLSPVVSNNSYSLTTTLRNDSSQNLCAAIP